MEKAPKHKIAYKIYKVSDDGLLKEPTEDYYGNKSTIFDEYETQEGALNAINNKGKWGTFIILPIAINDYVDTVSE